MSTSNYGLPTVSADSTMAFCDAVNGLATATDAVLHGIAEGYDDDPYTLPVATSQTLGGVRIGDGFKVYSDGLLTTSAERFELEPATKAALGGVIAGKNIDITDAGAVSVGDGAFKEGDITTAQLGAGAVQTSHIQDTAVTQEKLDAEVYQSIANPQGGWDQAATFDIGSLYASNWFRVARVRKLGSNFYVACSHNFINVMPPKLNTQLYLTDKNTPALSSNTGLRDFTIAWAKRGSSGTSYGIRSINAAHVNEAGIIDAVDSIVVNAKLTESSRGWIPILTIANAL